ncbi:hypothetical protein B0H16DRAFT_1850798 [Mycena metata]|uniref:Uncharacterized protein n=1 Tax=Mycena metata TaxID=1033252 RepID=A0AAD7N5M3_9AGAR|nr:hypothetical protein B0H16DRAFT_1850798 [Mycena metata]
MHILALSPHPIVLLSQGHGARGISSLLAAPLTLPHLVIDRLVFSVVFKPQARARTSLPSTPATLIAFPPGAFFVFVFQSECPASANTSSFDLSQTRPRTLILLPMVRMSAAHPASVPDTRTSLPRSRPPPHRAPLPFGPRDCANSARIVTLQTCASCIDARWRRERVHHKQYKSAKVRTIISSIHLSLPTHQARFLSPPSLASPASARIAPRTPSVRIHRAISDLIDDRSPLPWFL